MIAKRLFWVAVVLLAGLGSVFLLPNSPGTSPAGIVMKLPIWVGGWLGENAAVTQKELDALADDTQFARKIYRSPEGDQIYVSIVLSGQDMTNSIHRPERCLPAQGWSLLDSSSRNIPLPGTAGLQTTRLFNARPVRVAENQTVLIHNLTYYWFVGEDQVTPSHFVRTMIDIRDRILHGENQRWAYVTVAATVTEGIASPSRTESETAAIVEKFIKELAPELQRPNGTNFLAMLKK